MFKIYWQFYSQFTMFKKLINFLQAASSFLFRHLQRKRFFSQSLSFHAFQKSINIISFFPI